MCSPLLGFVAKVGSVGKLGRSSDSVGVRAPLLREDRRCVAKVKLIREFCNKTPLLVIR